eukprot:1133445-Amphidinium_carterae.1
MSLLRSTTGHTSIARPTGQNAMPCVAVASGAAASRVILLVIRHQSTKVSVECQCHMGFNGSSCDTFTGCQMGYEAVGSDGALPEVCRGILCGSTPQGDLLVNTTNAGRYPSTASFSCERGLTLIGASTASCGTDGVWELAGGGSPSCSGPEMVNGACTMGVQCELALTGSGLHGQNQAHLFQDALRCPSTAGAGLGHHELAISSTSAQVFKWKAALSASDFGGLTAG